MKKILLLTIVLFIGLNKIFATHNRAGEITYQFISSRTYKIIVTTYTNTDPATTQADRCELVVYFGDGDSATAPRVNGSSLICGTPLGDGEMIAVYTKKNIYETIHTYPGDGNYTITMEDPNRNQGICNIPNSVDQSFFLRTELVINPWLGPNSSPTLLNPPIDKACVGECFFHNPGAYDVNGDSLYYSLTTCYANQLPILGYSLPPNMSANDIDPLKGDLVWCTPPFICQYNVAILIKEYRRSPFDNRRYYIGSILRDMQIDVANCNNTPPQIKNINDTCIAAGTNLHFNVIATDAEANLVTLSATGGPFQLNPAATFTSIATTSPVIGQFNWDPSCAEVKLLPYLVTFKAADGNPTNPLVDFKSVFIRVIAPAPTALAATPSGASIILNWNTVSCNDTLGNNPLLGYKVYRKTTCANWTPGPCETGVPAYTGYTLIGNTGPSFTTFTDNNNGTGLINGVDYSYMVVAYYADGSYSYASTNVCAHLVRDVPIITNVSVISTGTNDSIWIRWVKPLGGSPNLDTVVNPPPYEYRLMQAQGFNPAASAFAQVAHYTQPTFYQLTDSSFISTGLNTQDTAYTYRVDFYSNGLFKGSTNTASSVYLKTTSGDKKVNLSWQQFVPWTNYRYDIYRAIPIGSSNYVKIDTSITTSYIDSGLVNGLNYCYKIVSVGQYSDTTLPRPLYNRSEIKCQKPVDMIPPCQPAFTVSNDCDLLQNVLSWTNPNTYCSTDAMQYNIYFAPTMDGALQLIYNSTDLTTTTFTYHYLFDGVPSVAGCYAVTAVDTVGNESPVVTKTCVDNCPVYNLPNVFTPNGDGKNDLFTALPYRFIKDINIKIYDRWGLLMFETTNPDVIWDGKDSSSKRLCADGVYFYICRVNEIHVDGIKPHVLKGYIQLIQDKNNRGN
jgi:gliding motility-associated-like protein